MIMIMNNESNTIMKNNENDKNNINILYLQRAY